MLSEQFWATFVVQSMISEQFDSNLLLKGKFCSGTEGTLALKFNYNFE